ncbi:MAG: RedB protein [Kofleriaceae bacterium]
MTVRKLGVVASIVLWSALVAIGAGTLYAYEGTPGERGTTPPRWPTASALPHDGITIAMFVHPECPCTRASIAELAAAISAKAPATLVVVVEGDPAEIADRLRALPSARIVTDAGVEAARFGAKTSGHVVAYDARGSLAFSGGITPGRGHVGDNMGRRSLERILAGGSAVDPTRAVLGCELEAR